MKNPILYFLLLLAFPMGAQDYTNSPWHLTATDIDPNNYYGITVANGIIGIVSSPEPMKVKEL